MLKNFLIKKGLSNRESEVAELVSQGLPNKEVAARLFVTEKTVKFHLTNIYKKMNVKSRAQLIVWCLPAMNFIGEREAQNTAEGPSLIPSGNQTRQPEYSSQNNIPVGAPVAPQGSTEMPSGNFLPHSVVNGTFDNEGGSDTGTGI